MSDSETPKKSFKSAEITLKGAPEEPESGRWTPTLRARLLKAIIFSDYDGSDRPVSNFTKRDPANREWAITVAIADYGLAEETLKEEIATFEEANYSSHALNFTGLKGARNRNRK